jgi:pimeloyl-ACP methyl ester carboxylesterase
MLKRLWAIGLATTLAWATVVASQEPSKRPAPPLSPEGGNRLQEVPFAEKGFTPLFDGKTLNGWTICCLPKDRALGVKAWTVDHGTILADTMGHKDHFYIWLTTNKEYGDFVLRLRLQVERNVPGNSGVQIRSRYIAETGWMKGPQIDIDPTNPQGTTSKLWNEGPGEHRWLANPIVKDAKLLYADEGDRWNDMEIIAKGMKITSRLNGVTVVDYNGAGVLDDPLHEAHHVGTKGLIGLQIHMYDELKLRFKDIRIKELMPDGAGGVSSTGKDRADVVQPNPRLRPIPSVKELADQLPCTLDFFDVKGCPAFLIRPKRETTSSPMPWVWYAPVIGHPNASHAWMLRQWLAKGIGVAGVDVGESHGSPQGRKVYTALWEMLTMRYGMSPKACLLPQSRGGLMLYNWAAENPSRVACIAGIYAVCDLRSYPGLEAACGAYGLRASELEAHLADHNPIQRLAPLAQAGVPILHIHGDADTVVPLEKNAGELARRYRALGGEVRLIVVPGKGHQVCDEFFHCQELVDFVAKHSTSDIKGSRP